MTSESFVGLLAQVSRDRSSSRMNLDANQAWHDGLVALAGFHAPWWSVPLFATVCISPWLIPRLSKAFLEHRNLSIEREKTMKVLDAELARRQQRQIARLETAAKDRLAPPDAGKPPPQESR